MERGFTPIAKDDELRKIQLWSVRMCTIQHGSTPVAMMVNNVTN